MMYFLSIAAIAALAMAGCTKYIPSVRPGGGSNPNDPVRPGGEEQEFNLNECTNWSIQYIGRADYEEDDGSISRVEEFHFNYPGQAYFIVRSITDANFKDWYANDLKSFIEGESSGVKVSDAFTSAIKTIYFDMLIHDTYTSYMIELSKDGKPTGNYAKVRHTVEEEMPTEAYLKWIGNWHVSDLNGYVGYDITISRCEANYLYYVDGWETGPAVQEQMNQDSDWIYARFRNSDKNLYFYGQYIMSYEDESLGTEVDMMFVGTYLTDSSDANGIVDVEGADYNYDIAHTREVEVTDGQFVIVLVPESFTFDNGFTATYHSMRYSRYCYDEQNWAHFNNSGVPSLPLKMAQLPATKSVQAPARRINSQKEIRRVQLRQHVPQKERTFKQ